jgi:hypothetical protein
MNKERKHFAKVYIYNNNFLKSRYKNITGNSLINKKIKQKINNNHVNIAIFERFKR